ncbi:MAG: FkbM family methyltransferase [Acidimicrobiales bacterium]
MQQLLRRIARRLLRRPSAPPPAPPIDRIEGSARVRTFDVAGQELLLGDAVGAKALDIIVTEIGVGAYDFSDITFEPGDVVVDLGAHVGAVSIWLAKKYPGLKIYAYEPIPESFSQLQANLERNDITNVVAFNVAVTGDGRDLEMVVWLDDNSAGGTAVYADPDNPAFEGRSRHVPSTTLDEIFAANGIERCKMLKIDIEGGEYEVLPATTILDRVEHVRGEFHYNTNLKSQGLLMGDLGAKVEAIVGPGRVRYTECPMVDF